MNRNVMQRPAASRTEEVDRRMARSAATGADRAQERRRVEAEVDAEAIAAADAAVATAEATAERRRIAQIVRAGRNLSRPKQALRMALAGPISLPQAEAILATLPPDSAAPATNLAILSHADFGTPSAQAERRRIAAILAHPSAVGRFTAAIAIAVEGEEAVPPEAATALLSGLPQEVEQAPIPSIAERAKGAAEFGAEPSSRASKAERTADIWKRAVADANKNFAAVVRTEVP